MAKVNLDITDRLDITCRQGDTFELTLTLKDSSGTALNLATDDYSFLMQVRGAKTSLSRQSASLRSARIPTGGGGGEADPPEEPGEGIANDPNIIIGSVSMGKKGGVNFTFNSIDDNGNVTVFLSASDMAKVAPGRYKYDLQYKVGDTQKTVLEGSFKVNSDISKALS